MTTEALEALVLAVDVSGSVNPQRFELQKMGYVTAFQNRRVLNAILSGRYQSIAVTMMQWSGPFLQAQVVPWTVLKDESSLKGFAAAIESTTRMMYGGGTSISGAIDQGAALFPQAPLKSERRVIDVSGDGSNNRGRSVTQARDEAVLHCFHAVQAVATIAWALEHDDAAFAAQGREMLDRLLGETLY